MNQENRQRSGFSGGVAKVLNAGGSAVVYVYDISSNALGGLMSLVKKVPSLPRRTTGMFAGGLGTIRPSEARNIETRIKEYEGKIQALYLEIGKEGARHPEAENPLEVETVKKLISDVREYEKEIGRLKDRVAELEAQRKAAAFKGRKVERAATEDEAVASLQQVNKAVRSAVQKAVRQGVFETTSERAIFDKVANDLLDSEMEIKILAAAELGKMGNEAAVPVLCEAVGFNDASLTSEVINSLINIGDSRAIPLFKDKVNDPKYRVRIGCLRGLYKLADDAEAMPVLVDALRDEHPEVRRTAATFIGWKDYGDAVSALIQSLRDEDERVRKAAASSLANIKDDSSVLPLIKLLGDSDLEVREKALEAIRTITGEDLDFDIHASGRSLTDAIEAIRDWWQKERLSKVDLTAVEESVEAYAAPEAAVEEPEAFIAEPETAEEEPEASIGETYTAGEELEASTVEEPAEAETEGAEEYGRAEDVESRLEPESEPSGAQEGFSFAEEAEEREETGDLEEYAEEVSQGEEAEAMEYEAEQAAAEEDAETVGVAEDEAREDAETVGRAEDEAEKEESGGESV